VRNTLRYLLLVILIIIGGLFLSRFSRQIRTNDFIEYWSAGKLILQGGNPYSQSEMKQIQMTEPITIAPPIMMFNPPWTLPVVIPFALPARPLGQILWLIAQIGAVMISANLLWQLYGGRPEQRWIGLLATFIFASTILVLEIGQITPFILLGITGFIYCVERDKNDLAAGAFLALVAIKPQIAIIFMTAVLCWVIQQRRYKIILGAGLAVALLLVFTMILNPHIIQQYILSLKANQIVDSATPTIGSYLRLFWVGVSSFWIQFLPSGLGVLWLIYYYFTRRESWNWLSELPIILLVSLITSPYVWTYDQVILLPAILLVFIWIAREGKHRSALILIALFVLINVLNFTLHLKLSEFWFIWVAPALLGWFLLARWQISAKQSAHLPSTPQIEGFNHG
jgi:Glycosyltransferase family 87